MLSQGAKSAFHVLSIAHEQEACNAPCDCTINIIELQCLKLKFFLSFI